MADTDALSACSPEDDGNTTTPSNTLPNAHVRNDELQSPEEWEIRRLRELIFSREIKMLKHLEEKVRKMPRFAAETVSAVIAEAIQLRVVDKDPALSMALEPLVDGIVKKSLHTRSSEFVNVLFPLMGPSIRKSIAESFRSMLGSFSKSVEMAFSWRGLRWRLEAIRSGKPFSEIVMLNTLIYRVEQMFFIHTQSGLVLSHLVNGSVVAQDADMVSAMLTAVQDFARDCFADGKDETLDTMQLSDFTIYIEKAPQAYLACVVRGMPPSDFHAQMRATLELMLVEYADALDSFNGDTEPFSSAARYFEPLMLSRYSSEDKELPFWAKALPVVLLLSLLTGGGYMYHEKKRLLAEKQAFVSSMNEGLHTLRAEPGLLVVNVEEAPQSPWHILVLKDALARSPEETLRVNGMDPSKFTTRIIPFISYSPSIIIRRINSTVKPPATVTMTFDDKGALAFSGTAPMAWIIATREDARAIPGVEQVDLSNVHDPRMELLSAMVKEVEAVNIEFPLGKDTPLPADMLILKKAIDTLVELEKITKEMGLLASLTIYGHADGVGNERRNYEISQSRTRIVAAMLYAKGSSMPISIYGMGAEYPRQNTEETETPAVKSGTQANRRIELRVNFSLSPNALQEMIRR